jgi:tRNA modification GTPase
MFRTDDTIVAIATPHGRGGIGVVRISGGASRAIAQALLDRNAPLQPRHATHARINGIDEVVATCFVAPHSYTGDDAVEISAHGSPVVLRTILEAAMRHGARLAEPGEFTLRAYLNGRIDLVQAEAVGDLIDAATPLQARTAFDQLEGTLTRRIGEIDAALFDITARLEASLDFPDEGYHFIDPADVRSQLSEVVVAIDRLLRDARRGRSIREGAHVAVVGRPNVGKSSVFNNLAGHDRAIVTPVPGTTRDLVTERVDVHGVPLALVDTAGIRTTSDIVEREGVDRARKAADVASLLLVVLDQSEPLREEDCDLLAETAGRSRVIVRNKIDLPAAWSADAIADPSVAVSAVTGAGVDDLRARVRELLGGREELRDTPAISNVRHIALLEQARMHIDRAIDATGAGAAAPEEFLLTDLAQARTALEEITGRRTPDDVLRHIFERFCVGK